MIAPRGYEIINIMYLMSINHLFFVGLETLFNDVNLQLCYISGFSDAENIRTPIHMAPGSSKNTNGLKMFTLSNMVFPFHIV